MIFTKKNFVRNATLDDDVMAFEYVLAMVCKLYYNSTFMIEDYIKMFGCKNEQTKGENDPSGQLD